MALVCWNSGRVLRFAGFCRLQQWIVLLNWRQRSFRVLGTARNIKTTCNIQSMRVCKAWLQVPLSQSVINLNQKFPDPEKLVNQVVGEVAESDPACAPSIQYTKSRFGTLWSAQLTVPWPVKFVVCGRTDDKDRACHYAYLLACDTLKFMGLLEDKPCAVMDYKQILEQALDPLLQKKVPTLEYISSKYATNDGLRRWQCHLNLNKPLYLSTVGDGKTKENAEKMASALMLTKLKIGGYFVSQHQLHKPPVLVLPSFNQTFETFEPDFEFYVDASGNGFGAFLLSHPRRCEETVRWICEDWPDEKSLNQMRMPVHSAFLEFYALLSVVYTWKKKFAGCKVLAWTDSLMSVNLITYGLKARNTYSRFYKSFQVLSDTCHQYKIELRCQHVCRKNNQAADSLSRNNKSGFVDYIQQVAPKANLLAKKPKKMLFYLPLVSDNFEIKQVEDNKDIGTDER